MAIPRVFISSTFYDLRQVREDIERFVRDIGYEPVTNESGSIPYGKDEHPEIYAYREVELCDIVVSIIGGRFGAESQRELPYSISQKELRTALGRGIQVFIFIDRNVLAEYQTYQLNKSNESIKYRFVDNLKIFQFIDEIHKLPRNNPIAPFDTSADIIKYLKIQWAGIFQRFLEDQQRLAELRAVEELNALAGTLKQLVDYLTEEGKNKDEAIQTILLANHPAFRRFAEVTNTAYRLYFTSRDELSDWLHSIGYRSELLPEDEFHEQWTNSRIATSLFYREDIFDDNSKLKIFSQDEWRDAWVYIRRDVDDIEDDEIPF